MRLVENLVKSFVAPPPFWADICNSQTKVKNNLQTLANTTLQAFENNLNLKIKR